MKRLGLNRMPTESASEVMHMLVPGLLQIYL